MDWGQAATAFSAAAAGTFTLMKVLSAIERRKNSPAAKEKRALFLNGDKEEVIREMQRLAQSDRDRNRDLLRLDSNQAEIMIELREIARRLDRSGIAP